jgi:holo-[acyl-carrier protein] synthase
MAMPLKSQGSMLTFRHGVDVVDIDRIADLIELHESRFLDRCFTRREQDYCTWKHKHLAERYAARFAAKEAAMKALGTGWARGIRWTDIEVEREGAGQPRLRITGRAAEVAGEQGIREWALSMSHSNFTAMASVIAWADRR